MIQTNITIIEINTINIVNIERNAPNVPLYTLKFSPAKSIQLQFLSLNTKFLIIKFFIQKTNLRKKEIRKICYYLIPGYNTEQTPTKSDKGGALLYISKELNYKSRNNLKLYKDKNLESAFIEVLSKSDKNTIIGCIYKHPNLPI